MSTGEKIPYKKAVNVAQRFLKLIEPHIIKAEVAGSVRRQCQMVGDVEIVVVENENTPLANLFGAQNPGMVVNGQRLKRFKYPEQNVQIELYITGLHDYGRILAIRTGSQAYSHHLAVTWNRNGYCGTEDGLRLKRECVKKSKWALKPEFKENPTLPPDFETEYDFFAFLGLPYVAPIDRNWSDKYIKKT